MPRKRFWRKGLVKKGKCHPSNNGFKDDSDMGIPPISEKVQSDSDMGRPPIQKKEQYDSMGIPPTKVQFRTINEQYDNMGIPPSKVQFATIKHAIDTQCVENETIIDMPYACNKTATVSEMHNMFDESGDNGETLSTQVSDNDADRVTTERNADKSSEYEEHTTLKSIISKNSIVAGTENSQNNCCNVENNASNSTVIYYLPGSDDKVEYIETKSEYCETDVFLCKGSASNLKSSFGIFDFQNTNNLSNLQSKNNICFGHFHQGDWKFPSCSRGLQCTCNALMFLIYSIQSMHTCINGNYIDDVLEAGDDLYRTRIAELTSANQLISRMLQFDELPEIVEIDNIRYSVAYKELIFGTVTHSEWDNSTIQTLEQGVKTLLSQHTMGLIIVGGLCSAVMQNDQGEIMFFDSHSHGLDGLSSIDGLALCMSFENEEQLINYLFAFYRSSNISMLSQFEIQPVVIKFSEGKKELPEKKDTEARTHSLLQNYLKHQCDMRLAHQLKMIKGLKIVVISESGSNKSEQVQQQSKKETEGPAYMDSFKGNSQILERTRATEQDEKKKSKNSKQSRSLYMKNYMRKKRKDVQYRAREKQNQKSYKTQSRKNQLLRNEEMSRERLWKQKARENESYCQAEKENQKAYRAELRKDETYRNKEKESQKTYRVELRKDDIYRNKEKDIQKAYRAEIRKDGTYKDKEKEHQKAYRAKLREDETYRNKEKESQKTYRVELRKDDTYRNKEKDIQKAYRAELRKDGTYRNKEKDIQKAYRAELRKDGTYKDNEKERQKAYRTEQRKDDTYKNKEKETQKAYRAELRKDGLFKEQEKHKDLTIKRKARENPEFVEKEKIRKRKARTNLTYRTQEKQRELISKQKARKDSFFLERERIKKTCVRQSMDKMKQKTQKENDKLRKSSKRKEAGYLEVQMNNAKKRKYGTTVKDCIRKFHDSIKTGPNYICTCCQQTWFRHSVSNVKNIHRMDNLLHRCRTQVKSVSEEEWICTTCYSNISKGLIPKMSVVNGMKFPPKPPELNLFPLEERLISLRIPFMQLRELPRGRQLSMKGNVVNVPVEIQPTVQSLPRVFDKNITIPVRLKKKLSYKKYDFNENVRPLAVMAALHWLMQHSHLYKNSGVSIDERWIEEVNRHSNEMVQEYFEHEQQPSATNKGETEANSHGQKNENSDVSENFNSGNKPHQMQQSLETDNDGNESDTFSEVDANECHVGNSDTLLENASVDSNRIFTFAPGEGQSPLSLYQDENSEYLSFPTLFCGQKREETRQVKVHYSDIAKWELRCIDRRVAQSVPNIFFKLKKIQMKQISDKVNLALRKCKTKGKKITAAEARDLSKLDSIVRLDEGYYIFKQLRNSPAYLAAKKKDVFAMIRQLGLPTWFISLSSADTRWPELLKTLSILCEGAEIQEEQLDNMTWAEKTKLVQRDPVTCARYFDNRVNQFINLILKSPHAPVGKVKDFFYRVEFQHRGSPHIHMLVWTENSPKYGQSTDAEIVEFVDTYLLCESENDVLGDLTDLQMHKHSHSCRKKGKDICRFGFPLPPMPRTMVLEPLEDDVEKYQKMYKELQSKIDASKNGPHISFKIFLQQIANISEEDYIKCIRSSINGPKVFLRRNLWDVRTNLYNENLLLAWKANLDIQFVLDPYACAMYIVSYISKSQRGLSALLDRACREARHGNMDIKRQVRHIGNQFLNSVEVSAQEACYLILQMPLAKSTREVVFVNTSPANERISLLKPKSILDDLPADSTDVEALGLIHRYSIRPKQLEKWCLADYASKLEIKYDKEVTSDDERLETNEDEILGDNAEEFGDDDIVANLKNGIVITRRTVCRILRYVHFSLKTDPENFFREKLMLFLPWRNEVEDLLNVFESYRESYHYHQSLITPKITEYEHNVDDLQQAKQTAEEDYLNYDRLVPNNQQTEAEDEHEGVLESEQFVHFNPDRPVSHRQVDIGSEFGVASTITADIGINNERLPEEEYLQLMRSLNERQREYFTHVIHWIKTKEEPLFSFLSGGAGVGKSVLIRALFQTLHRHLYSTEGEDPDDIRILLCAFTGKAAYNINGVTIASAFHKKYNQSNQNMNADELNTFRTKYRHLQLVIIDEISMVGNRMLSFINTRLQELTATKKPFGGISIIAVGDLFQLQPVCESWIFSDFNDGLQALSTNLWQEHFQIYELTEIMRQKNDLKFAELLNRLRLNNLSDEDFKIIEAHCLSSSDPKYIESAMHLFIENVFVKKFNDNVIEELHGSKTKVECQDDVVINSGNKSNKEVQDLKKKLTNSLPDDHNKTANLKKTLCVAVGMIYDITVNLNVSDGIANGSSCIVKKIDYRIDGVHRPSIIWVLFHDSKIGISTRKKYLHLYTSDVNMQWTPIFEVCRPFMYNYKSFRRMQFPLVPSAAKTVHKAQGTTVDQIVIDLSQTRTRKIPHIHYVALSRVRSIEQMHIVNFNKKALCVDERVKDEMTRLRTESSMSLCYTPIYRLQNHLFKTAFINSRSFHKHFNDFVVDQNFFSADVVGIAESRLMISDKDEQFFIPGYRMIRNDEIRIAHRTSRPYHGLVVYYKDVYIVEDVHIYSMRDFEFIVLSIKDTCNTTVQVVAVYKSPSCSLQSFKEKITEILLPLIDFRFTRVILGDFNFDLKKGNTSFLDFMNSTFEVEQFVDKATTDSGAMLDLIFSNSRPTYTDTLETYWSDHKIVFSAFDFSNAQH